MDKIIIHPSTLNRLTCRLQYTWGNIYRPSQDAPHLVLGSAIHKGLEAYYGSGQKPSKGFKAIKTYFRNNSVFTNDPDAILGQQMFQNYVDNYRGREHFTVIYAEKEAARKIPIPYDENPLKAETFYIGAIIDAIVIDEKLDKTFVMEHKTFSRFYSDSLDRDHQFVFETFIAQGLVKDPEVVGLIYNGLRSRAKATGKSNLFERRYLYINQRQIDIALYRAYWTLKQVHSGNFKIYPEPQGLKCTFCNFKTPCAAYMAGEDWKFLLENTFKKKTYKESKTWSPKNEDVK